VDEQNKRKKIHMSRSEIKMQYRKYYKKTAKTLQFYICVYNVHLKKMKKTSTCQIILISSSDSALISVKNQCWPTKSCSNLPSHKCLLNPLQLGATLVSL